MRATKGFTKRHQHPEIPVLTFFSAEQVSHTVGLMFKTHFEDGMDSKNMRIFMSPAEARAMAIELNRTADLAEIQV